MANTAISALPAASSVAGTDIVPIVQSGATKKVAANLLPISTAQATINAAKADLVGGVVPSSQIPALALITVVPVASRAAMLALTTSQVQPGDVAVDTSTGSTRGSYILTNTDPSVIGNWVLLNAPLDVVQSVNGQQGTVVLAAADVGAAALASPALTGNPTVNGLPVSTLPTKRVTHSFGAARGSVAAAAITDWVERVPLVLPVKTSRWRLRVSNVSQLDGTAYTTPWTVSSIYFGQAVASGVNRPTGAFTATPTVVSTGGTVPVDGTDLVTPWVTDPASQLGPQMNLVSYGLSSTNSGTGTVVKTSRNLFRNSSAGAASTIATAAATGYAGNTGALDIRVEYEFVGANQVGLFIGDSITEGYNSDSADTLAAMAHESWPGAFGLARRIAWVNAGIIGCTEAPFLSATTFGLKRFDLTTTTPDFAIIALGSNSASAGTAAATIESNIATIIATVQGLGISRIYLATVTPRNFTSGGTNETIRTTLNTWISTLPGNISGIVDFDQLVRDPANLNAMQAEIVNSDGIHPKRLGYQRMAARVHL